MGHGVSPIHQSESSPTRLRSEEKADQSPRRGQKIEVRERERETWIDRSKSDGESHSLLWWSTSRICQLVLKKALECIKTLESTKRAQTSTKAAQSPWKTKLGHIQLQRSLKVYTATGLVCEVTLTKTNSNNLGYLACHTRKKVCWLFFFIFSHICVHYLFILKHQFQIKYLVWKLIFVSLTGLQMKYLAPK